MYIFILIIGVTSIIALVHAQWRIRKAYEASIVAFSKMFKLHIHGMLKMMDLSNQRDKIIRKMRENEAKHEKDAEK